MRISCKFAWYDLWVGMFIDQRKGFGGKRIYYICPLPCCVIVIDTWDGKSGWN